MDHYHIYPNNNPVRLSNTDTVISKLKKKRKWIKEIKKFDKNHIPTSDRDMFPE